MIGREYLCLQGQEISFLDYAVAHNLITRGDLPRGISIGLDSMGPVRDPKTDALFPGTREALHVFRNTLQKHDLILVVATNGPDKEGEDILEAIKPNHKDLIRAYAVTEGGGRMISFSEDNSGWNYRTLAHPEEVNSLDDIVRTASRRSRLMEILLSDTEPDARGASIRTDYHTNIVLTFPKTPYILSARLREKGIDLYKVMPDISTQNYLEKMLAYTADQLHDAISELKLGEDFSQLTKKQNRRHYVTPRHLLEELKQLELSKIGGVWLASAMLSSEFPGLYRGYNLVDSIYVADKAVDVTGEGQTIIGASERSMIVGYTYFIGDPSPGVKIVKEHNPPSRRSPRSKRIHFVDIGTRMTINITMDDDTLPSLREVEGIRVLNIGSGGKALEALTHLYGKLYD